MGYGDIYPVTPEGRIAATVLMVLGIALFGIVTATATSLLMRPAGTDGDEDRAPAAIGALHKLAQAGAITAGEFEAQKAELLARI